MFYKSLEFADTTSKDCDYKKLSRIHGQIATILLRQHALDDALKEMDCIDRYAQKTNDTLMWLVNKEQSGLIYNMKGDKDSAFIVREFASNMFMKYGMTEQFARSVGPSIAYLLEKGNIKKAKQYIDLYESKSGFFDETDHIVLANKNFYDLKGRYYLCVGKTDSAAYYFRKEIKEAGITNNLETAYKGLSLYYKATNLPDSAAKYALLALEMNDSSYNELSTDYYQRMQAAYNYSNAQQKATRRKLLLV